MTSFRPSLTQLEMRGNFINRHIGPNPQQTKDMLAELGISELEDIIDLAIPANILNHEPLKLTETISERAVIKHLRIMRERNKVFTSMIGMGYFDTIMPAVIKRNVLENPGLVHGLHTLSGRSQPGTIGSTTRHFSKSLSI